MYFSTRQFTWVQFYGGSFSLPSLPVFLKCLQFSNTFLMIKLRLFFFSCVDKNHRAGRLPMKCKCSFCNHGRNCLYTFKENDFMIYEYGWATVCLLHRNWAADVRESKTESRNLPLQTQKERWKWMREKEEEKKHKIN